MATDAGAHVVFDQFLSAIHDRHVAVAGRALDALLYMRRMLELNQGVGLEAVDADPRDILALLHVVRDLLDLGFILGQLGMAEHAFVGGRDGRDSLNVSSGVAVDTCQTLRDV